MTALKTEGRVGLATDLRLLTIASRLRRFTVTELAEHAEVTCELARSFLRRSADVERIDVQPQGGRGRPKTLWRLRPERTLPVAAQVAAVSRLIGLAPMQTADQPSILQRLQSSLKELEQRPLADIERGKILHRAEMYLASAEMDLRDRSALSQPVSPAEEQAVEQARQRIRCWRAITDKLPAWTVVLRPTSQARVGFKRCLSDWTAPIPTPELSADEARSELIEHGAPGILEVVLGVAARDQTDDDSALDPALAMLQHKAGWDADMQSALAHDIVERLVTPAVADNAFLVTALAATAAAFEVSEAAEPLLLALLNRRLASGLPGDWRAICLQSLARLARPAPLHNPEPAAVACQYLLARATEPSDFAILAPAALGALHNDGSSLLRGIGRRVFSEHQSTAKGAVSRNIGMVLADSNFKALQGQVDSLVDERDEDGRRLMQGLHAPQYWALDLTDSGGREYVVRPYPPVAKSLGMTDPGKVALTVGARTGKWLMGLASEHIRSSEWRGGTFTRGITQRARSPIEAVA